MLIFFIFVLVSSSVVLFIIKIVQGIKDGLRAHELLSKKYGFDNHMRGKGFWMFNCDVIKLKKENAEFNEEVQELLDDDASRSFAFFLGFLGLAIIFFILGVYFDF